MAHVGTLDFRGFVDDRKGARAGGPEGGGHSYAYISDKHTRSAFEQIEPVELAVTAMVRFFKAVGRNQLLGNAVKVGPNQFPRVHKLVLRASDTLGIVPPTLYIQNSPFMNAMTFGTNDDSFIVVHSALVDQLSEEELLSVIGHEAGHIHNSHVVYLTALYYVTHIAGMFMKRILAPAEIALSGWKRRAELTCDRAGLLCAKDLGVAKQALAKLALGSTKLYNEFNLEEFENQYEEAKGDPGRFAEIAQSHPWLSKRLRALAAFAESELYRKHAGIGSGGLTMAEVDEKVHAIVKVVSTT